MSSGWNEIVHGGSPQWVIVYVKIVKIQQNQCSSFWHVGDWNLPSPTAFSIGLYNSLYYYKVMMH